LKIRPTCASSSPILAMPGPVLVDVRVIPDEVVRRACRATSGPMLICFQAARRPVPFLPREEFLANMIVKPCRNNCGLLYSRKRSPRDVSASVATVVGYVYRLPYRQVVPSPARYNLKPCIIVGACPCCQSTEFTEKAASSHLSWHTTVGKRHSYAILDVQHAPSASRCTIGPSEWSASIRISRERYLQSATAGNSGIPER